MSVALRTVRGLLWAYGTFVVDRLLSLAISIVLARLLLPEEFGLIAVAILLIGVFDALRDVGIKDALIYAPGPVEDSVDTAFWLNLAIGIFQVAVILALAPLAVHMVDDPRIVEMLRVLALAPLINALSATHEGLLQRRLAFRQRYLCDLWSTAAKTAVVVGLVLADYGVWSFVAGQLVGAVVRATARWLYVRWTPRPLFSLARARALLRFGVHILLVNLVGLLNGRVDQFAIAAILGPVELAVYFLAARVPELLLTNFGIVLTRVMFPAYASIKASGDGLVPGLHITMRYTALVTVPVALGLVAVAPELIHVLFGARWSAAAPVLSLLALTALTNTMPWSAGDAFKAVGRPDVTTRFAMIEACYLVPLVLGGAYFGQTILAAAAALLTAEVVANAYRLWFTSRFFGFSPKVYIRLFGGPLAAGVIMLIAVEFWRSAFADWPQSLLLATSVAVGALTYCGVVWRVAHEEIDAGWRLLRRALVPTGSAVEADSPGPAKP